MSLESSYQKIKEFLNETGIKQAHLAKKIGISAQQLNNILRNEQQTKYLPKIIEFVDSDIHSLDKEKQQSTFKIQILSDSDLTSLADNCVSFEEIENVNFENHPFRVVNTHHFFAYKLQYDLSFDLYTNDLLLFNTFLPLKNEITGVIGIVYSQRNKKIIVGRLQFDSQENFFIIYNKQTVVQLKDTDILIGVAEQINRKLLKSNGDF